MKIWHQIVLHFSWCTMLSCKITHMHTEAVMWLTLWCWCCLFLIVSGFFFSVTSMKALLLWPCSCSELFPGKRCHLNIVQRLDWKGNFKCASGVEDRARPGVTKTSWTGGVSSVVALVVAPRSHHWWLVKSLFLFLSCQVLSAWTQSALWFCFILIKPKKLLLLWLQKLIVKGRCCPLLALFFRNREEKQKIKSWCLEMEMTGFWCTRLSTFRPMFSLHITYQLQLCTNTIVSPSVMKTYCLLNTSFNLMVLTSISALSRSWFWLVLSY